MVHLRICIHTDVMHVNKTRLKAYKETRIFAYVGTSYKSDLAEYCTFAGIRTII